MARNTTLALHIKLQKPLPASVWDLLSGLFFQHGSIGIDEGEEKGPDDETAFVDGTEFELALKPGLLQPPRVFSVFFARKSTLDEAAAAVKPVLAPFRPRLVIQSIRAKDYSKAWRKTVKPITVPPLWRVRAPWHKAKKGRKHIELIIEPGMAFGTGSHETTRACLEILGELGVNNKLAPMQRWLDFGCGSGILSIALAKLGVNRVLGVDIDPLAITATRQNAKINYVRLKAAKAIAAGTRYDGIVANILKNTLLDFAPRFKQWLKPKGRLVLSGILANQEKEILRAYKKLGFHLESRLEMGETDRWVTLALVRAA